ncbi:MAG: D-alanine--D-alanine ligase [Phycisphaerae bacterium]|nr:D-alanine--D-alanine ligase [Phycisphaerae bacterium]
MDFDIPSGLKVAVLMGAVGQERQISLQSGKCVADALRKTKLLEVIEQDYQPASPQILDDKSIDVFFLVFHGEFGEGGDMQEICEKKNLVFTGCDSKASRLGFDKMACKKVLRQAKLPVPDDVEIRNPEHLDTVSAKLRKMGPACGELACPEQGRRVEPKFVIKPIRQGSSVGVRIVQGAENAKIAAEKCAGQFGDCMIEEFIAGREITVGILENEVLPVIEIRTTHQFYDYDAKYNDDTTRFLFDTIDDKQILQKINDVALKSFNALGCRDFSRVDMILSGDGIPYVIEINTIPGFTTHSLLPKAAAKAGIEMSQLCLRIINSALKRVR